MGTKFSLTLIGAVFGFSLGLLLGIWDHEWGGVPNVWSGMLVTVLPNAVLVSLIVLANWRRASGTALLGGLVGAIMGASLILGHFFTVVVTDRTLAEYGGELGWNAKLTFGVTLYAFAGALLGFIYALAIRVIASGWSWIARHTPRSQPRRSAA